MKAHEPVAPLRDDLQVLKRGNGFVEVRDPHRLQVLTIHAGDFEIAEAFDGETSVHDLVARGADAPGGGDRRRIRRVIEEFESLYLLDTPEAWDAPPVEDNVAPWTQMDARRGLHVLPIAAPDAHWGCNGCGACCHGLQVELTAEEDARIDRHLYDDVLEGEDYAEEVFLTADRGPRRVLRQTGPDQACVFLADDGRCWIHARQGMEAKPDPCQIFPLMVVHVPDERPRIGVRVNCQSMYQTYESGPPVSAHAQHALRISRDAMVHKAPARIRMFKKHVRFEEFDALCRDIRGVLWDHGVGLEAFRRIDKRHLGHRWSMARSRYGARLRAYITEERDGALAVGSGAYADVLARVARGERALAAMAKGKAPREASEEVQEFLRKQINNLLYLSAPLNLPDAGYGLVAVLLATEATLHATGKHGGLKVANAAFDVFTNPIVETLEHAWPILDAIDKKFARKMRKEMC